MDTQIFPGAQPDGNSSAALDIAAVDPDVPLPGIGIGGDPESSSQSERAVETWVRKRHRHVVNTPLETFRYLNLLNRTFRHNDGRDGMALRVNPAVENFLVSAA